jgi:hypothetical protein
LAGIAAVLTAIGRAVWRDLRSFHSITGNNFFYFLVLVAYQQAESAEFFSLILGLLVLFPLSANPLEKVPADRWEMWPLSTRQRGSVRVACLALSPITWFTAVLLWRAGWRSAAWFAGAALMARLLVIALGLLNRKSYGNLLTRIPAPGGWVGGLVRLQVRQMLSTLDPYVAILLALGALAYKFSGPQADPAAFRVMTLVVAIALSTWGQVLFGLDGSGTTRFRMMPLRGWQLLLAKDLAFLGILLVLVVALDPLGGMTAGFAALAIGHHASVLRPVPQTRWRFTAVAAVAGIFQALLMTAAGAATWTYAWVLPASIAVWTASLIWYGWKWDAIPGE